MPIPEQLTRTTIGPDDAGGSWNVLALDDIDPDAERVLTIADRYESPLLSEFSVALAEVLGKS